MNALRRNVSNQRFTPCFPTVESNSGSWVTTKSTLILPSFLMTSKTYKVH